MTPLTFSDAETARLAALRELDILDTAPEPGFDRLVRLAARIFNVPTALVSLVDAERQWFKARCGLEAEQTPRSFSFCAHAILGDDVMVVPDATLDPRFAGNPLVTGELHIRFYAGAPLVTPDGHKLGSLCVIDRVPRQATTEQCESLRELAAMAVDEMLLRRMGEKLSRANRDFRSATEENIRFGSIIAGLGTGVIVVDPSLPDFPITFANQAFVTMTGYGHEEILGRNCRFLQGPGTDKTEVAKIRRKLVHRQSYQGTLLNYRKDGTPFWNALTINPVYSEDGTLINFVGLQVDTTAERQTESSMRDRALQAAALAELSQRALDGVDLDELLNAAVTAASSTLGMELCRVTELLPESGDLLVRAGAGWKPGIVGKERIPVGARTLASRVVASGGPWVIEDLQADADFTGHDIGHMHGAVSAMSVNIQGRDKPFGALCIMSRRHRHFSQEDVYFLQGLANVLAAAIDRQRDEEALRRSDTRFQRITANVPGMVYQSVTNAAGEPQGRTFVSEACREIFGVEPAVIYDHSDFITRCVHADDRADFLRSVRESIVTMEPWRWQGRIVLPCEYGGRQSGEKWIQCVARPERQPDGVLLWDGLLTDITEAKRNERLRQEKEEAEHANLAKSEFLSRMSHELRTPLNAILGFGQLLQIMLPTDAQEKRPPSPDSIDSVQHIVSAGRHLLKMVDEVLDLARIEAGHISLSPEPVSVDRLLVETLALVRPLAAEHGITPETVLSPGEPHVCADQQRLKQVLINLLSNAVKYNRDNGRVVVSTIAGLETGRLRIRVEDTGPGIAQEWRSQLFTPFERLGAELGTIPGTGLGLALSKRLIEAMDGQIGLEDGPPVGQRQGSVFWVELPLAAKPVKRIGNGAFPTGSGLPGFMDIPPGQTLLYIEDNLSNVHLIERLMTRFPSVRMLAAMQGSIGLDLARQHQPDVILLDAHLPDLSGSEVLTRLRADSATRRIPVVIVSADATGRQVEHMLRLGACTYLTKPLDVRVFLEVIHQIFSGEIPEPVAHRM